jgi:predicted RNase H-like HicB family nuclease
MSKRDKTLRRILLGDADENIAFAELRHLMLKQTLGFGERIRGDHYIFTRSAGTAMNLKYEIIIYWSTENAAFIAEAPELPGCMADGRTHGDALDNLQVDMREWIETAQALGRVGPELRGRLLFA